MIKIKKATENDIEVIALLGRITYSQSHSVYIKHKEDLLKYCDEAFSITKIGQDLKSKNQLYYLMYLNDLPIGYSKLLLNTNHDAISSTNNCRLDKIYILENFLHLKLGQQLLNFVIAEAQQINLDTIWLVVYIKNSRAIKFYQKNGFEPKGEILFNVNGTNYLNFIYSKNIQL